MKKLSFKKILKKLNKSISDLDDYYYYYFKKIDKNDLDEAQLREYNKTATLLSSLKFLVKDHYYSDCNKTIDYKYLDDKTIIIEFESNLRRELSKEILDRFMITNPKYTDGKVFYVGNLVGFDENHKRVYERGAKIKF